MDVVVCLCPSTLKQAVLDSDAGTWPPPGLIAMARRQEPAAVGHGGSELDRPVQPWADWHRLP